MEEVQRLHVHMDFYLSDSFSMSLSADKSKKPKANTHTGKQTEATESSTDKWKNPFSNI